MTYNSITHPPDPSQGAADVRLATGNLLPEDYPDSELEKKIKSAYSKIQGAVRRALDEPFIEDVDVWRDHCVQLEITMAAMYALKAYGPEFLDKITELRTEVNEDIKIMQDALGITDEVIEGEEELEEGTIESTDLKAWCVNGSQVMIPNRMKGCKGDDNSIEGIGPVRLDHNSDYS